VTNIQTDGQTDEHRFIAALCIASRGKFSDVSTQRTRVTDGQTDIQTVRIGIEYTAKSRPEKARTARHNVDDNGPYS